MRTLLERGRRDQGNEDFVGCQHGSSDQLCVQKAGVLKQDEHNCIVDRVGLIKVSCAAVIFRGVGSCPGGLECAFETMN